MAGKADRWLAASAVMLGVCAALTAGTAVAHADGSTSAESSSSAADSSSSPVSTAGDPTSTAGAAQSVGTSPANPGSLNEGAAPGDGSPSSVVGNGRPTATESSSPSPTQEGQPAESPKGRTVSAFDIESVGTTTATSRTDGHDVRGTKPVGSEGVSQEVSEPQTAAQVREETVEEPVRGRRDSSEPASSQVRQSVSAQAADSPTRTSEASSAAVDSAPAAAEDGAQLRVAAASTTEALETTQPTTYSAPPQPAFTIFAPIRDLVVSISNWLNQLPSNPITDLLQGAFLWLRRTFFNEPPTLTPVQTTGQQTGTITGTFGGVDPEREAIKYRVVHEPLHGTLAVTPEGRYTYTPGADFDGTDVFTVAATDAGTNLNLANPWQPHTTYANVDIQQGADVHQLDFKFTYGVGAQHWSQQAKTEFEYAAKVLSTYFVVTSPVTIDYAVIGANVRGTTADGKPNCVGSVCSGTLASAISPLVSDDPGFYQTVVQKKIISGVDANGSAADGNITFNFGKDWGFGNSVTSEQFDFNGTAMHELLHTFGFADAFTKPGENTNENWYTYDQFVTNATGAKVITTTDFKFDTAYTANLTGGNGGLYFSGPNAVAAYGDPVPLYTPSEYSSSSVGHLDDDTFKDADPNSRNAKKLMNAADGEGLGVRTLSPVEIGILKDLGYTMAATQSTSG